MLLKESRTMFENIDKHFLHRYSYVYHILAVDNRLFDCYSFFLQARKQNTKLLYSYDLVEFKHDKALYNEVLRDLKEHYNFSIEYRDTDHLVHPGEDIVEDHIHGHGG